MSHRGNLRALIKPNRQHLRHKWNVRIFGEPITDVFAQNTGRKRAERLPALDFRIEDVLNVRAAWVGQNRAIS